MKRQTVERMSKEQTRQKIFKLNPNKIIVAKADKDDFKPPELYHLQIIIKDQNNPTRKVEAQVNLTWEFSVRDMQISKANNRAKTTNRAHPSSPTDDHTLPPD